MPRELSEFNGKCLLLCGGWSLEHRKYKSYKISKDIFYTIDLDPSSESDAVFDITERIHWQQFKDSSFDFIFFEATPFLDNMEIAFEECLRLLSDNGIVFYQGGSRFLPAKYESIPHLLQNVGFKQCITGKSFIDFQGKSKFDKGSYTLAGKNSSLLTQGFLNQNLPEEALKIIKCVNFFQDTSPNFQSFFSPHSIRIHPEKFLANNYFIKAPQKIYMEHGEMQDETHQSIPN